MDLRQQGKGLAIEFLRSSLPEGLRRRLDVADFGTPVQSITTTQQGDKVRMLVEPVGDGSTVLIKVTINLSLKCVKKG